MKYLKLYATNILIMTIIFFCLTFLFTILSYFNVINDNTISIFNILTMFITMFIGGFLTSRKCQKKGWLEGLKIGSIFISILIIVNIISIRNFELKTILYFIILLFSSMLGGMIGILKNKS